MCWGAWLLLPLIVMQISRPSSPNCGLDYCFDLTWEAVIEKIEV